MTDLLSILVETYGGIERWKEIRTITARKKFGGVTWPAKGVPGILDDGTVTVSVQEEKAVFTPFLTHDQQLTFTPEEVRITGPAGREVDVLGQPRKSFEGHTLQTPWNPLQLGYFAGYAMWTYLTEPYSLTLPGVRTEEIDPWQEDGQTWRRLAVTYPPTLASHSAQQVVYVDQDGLLRRRDYTVDVLGGVPGIHYVEDHEEVDGILVPRTRTVYGRGEDNLPQREPVIVSISLEDLVVR